jgi:hypothetical protein
VRIAPPTKNRFLAPKRGSPKPRAELTPPPHPKKLPSPSGHLLRCDPKNHGRRRMCFDVLFNYTLQPMSTLRADLTQHLIISTNKCICTCFECNKLPSWLSSQSGQILNQSDLKFDLNAGFQSCFYISLFLRRFFQKILSLCTACIQERLVIKSGL